MIKKDCFAYDCGSCTALEKLFCEFEPCSFYKSTRKPYSPVKGNIDDLIYRGGYIVTSKDPKHDCEYYIGNKQKYCRATTQESCYKCDFYNPKFPTKAQFLADMLAVSYQTTSRLTEKLAVAECTERIFDEY